MAFKKTSSIITISNLTTESAANTFTQAEVDLQLSPLDNEIFVVLALDTAPNPPDAVPGLDTATSVSVSTTSRTTVGSVGNNNVLGAGQSLIRAAGYVDGGVGFQQFSGETPTANLDYIGILATNNFFVQIEGVGNLGAKNSGVRLWGYRARADAATYAALVQSEVLSS
tara:strand:- start:1058 stop:1564 length:507 start_codon:yes stop_codon:yes gene_type:complete